MNLTIEERFWSKVDRRGPDDCWEWRTGRSRGYGEFWHHGKNVKAHRLAYEFCIGPIPDGLDVLHSCDNPPCCNPAHLWAGTQADNSEDMTEKNRQAHPSGELNAMHKLTEQMIFEIRDRYTGIWGQETELAKEFGVSISTIEMIVNHKTWRHVK